MFSQEMINEMNESGRNIFDMPFYGNLGGKYRSFQAKPRPGIWPPPVYEAHYADGRVVRMSFWSAKGKPVDATARRQAMQSKGELVNGFIEQAGKAIQDPHFSADTTFEPQPAKRITAKQARAGLGRLLACLDGTITDHDQIRSIVIECRELAA